MVVVDDCQAVVGQQRTQDVLAQGEPAMRVVGGNLGRSVKIEPSVLPAQVTLGQKMSVGFFRRELVLQRTPIATGGRASPRTIAPK